MKLLLQKISSFSLWFVQILSLIFTGWLFISAFFATCYALDMTSQQVLTRRDHILWNLAGLAFFVLLLSVLQYMTGKNIKKRLPLLFGLVCAWCILTGSLLILFSKTVPAADAMSVYGAAENLACGDTSVIHPTDSYLSYYPQQVGLLAFFELIIRVWKLLPTGLPAYHAIKCIYVLLAVVIVLFQYRTVQLLWNDHRTNCFYLLLMGLNLPFLMYTSFVYGEIPSFAAMSIGTYYLFCLLRATVSDSDSSRQYSAVMRYCLLSLLFFTLSVLLRKNSLIFMIAVCIVVLLQFLRQNRPILLLFAILCTICSLSILPLIQQIYEYRAGSTLSSGVPPISYFAMGMQESSRGNGWYNGFNFYTYQETGLDAQAASSISRTAIEERLRYFKAHPDYTTDFYLKKYLSQWADGTYACRQATLATFGGRRDFFNSLYEGDYSKYFIEYGNHYQNLIYFGAFLFCLRKIGISRGFRRKTAMSAKVPDAPAADTLGGLPPLYLGLIAAFGGFLFHMIWEANSRYIFPYSLLLIPYAAQGLTAFQIRFFRRHHS